MKNLAILLTSMGLLLITKSSVFATDWERQHDYLKRAANYQQNYESEVLSAERFNFTSSPLKLDPAICKYRHEIVSKEVYSFDVSNLVALNWEMTEINELKFANFTESTPNYNVIIEFLCSAYLETIRILDFSHASGFDVDRFLRLLISQNKGLRSLTHIKAANSNLTTEALFELKNKIQFNRPLIRDISVISSRTGQNVAQIHVSVRGTEIINKTLSEKVELQNPTDRSFDILYRANLDTISIAHLQLVFE